MPALWLSGLTCPARQGVNPLQAAAAAVADHCGSVKVAPEGCLQGGAVSLAEPGQEVSLRHVSAIHRCTEIGSVSSSLQLQTKAGCQWLSWTSDLYLSARTVP